MSLDQTAEQTGVSKSMLAQIERGTANPSLGVLGKVTSGLRIEFQELIQPPREDCLLVTPQELLHRSAPLWCLAMDQRAGRAIPGMDLSAV